MGDMKKTIVAIVVFVLVFLSYFHVTLRTYLISIFLLFSALVIFSLFRRWSLHQSIKSLQDIADNPAIMLSVNSIKIYLTPIIGIAVFGISVLTGKFIIQTENKSKRR